MSLLSLQQSMFPDVIASRAPARKTPGKTVIAHISDLHFKAKTDFNNQPWNALAADLTAPERSRVDILVVTGDLIDAPLTAFPRRSLPKWLVESETSAAFSNVSNYLQSLCEDLSINPAEGLFVVPGNHDYRLLGIHKSRRQPQEFCDRFRDFCRPLLLPTLGLCVFVLDSNVMEFLDLAAARMDRNHLVSFFKSATKVEAPNLTRIALLHHHPMPIPETEKEGLFNNPGYTMLKNAGQVMTAMVSAKIDLILHGHEHHAAYSKAMFPFDDREHFMTVISAGSVSNVRDNIGNYNLITIADDGQIDLERRSLENRTLYRNQSVKKLRNYEDARRVLFETYAMASNAQLRAERVIRHYHIKAGSGDAVLHEQSKKVSAYSSPVHEWPMPMRATGGFFFTPKFDNLAVKWQWDEASSANPANPDERTGKMVFDPPLTREKPISFDRTHQTFNLFQFNQQDRMDLTQDKSATEAYILKFQNAVEIFTATLLFPEGRFPEDFEYSVENPNNEEDALETEYFSNRVSTFPQSRTITYTMEKPLPGYKYQINWRLPPLEQDEMNLSGPEKALGDEVVRRMLKAIDPTHGYQEVVRNWLEGLRTEITNSRLWRELKGNDDLELSLYVDDRSQRGLVCVVASPQAGVFIPPWPDIIKPGDSLIGEAYRRRQPAFYNPMSGSVPDKDEYQVRIPDSWRSAFPGIQYIANCAIPLTYPLGRGRRVAVLTFASKNGGSRLLRLLPDKNDEEDRKKDKKIRQGPLIEKVTERQSAMLYSSLGVEVITRVSPTGT